MSPLAKLRILSRRASKLYMRRRIKAAVPLANDIIRIHALPEIPEFFRVRGRGLYCAYSTFGMNAVLNGGLQEAGEWLLKAGKTYPSPARRTFGPNMILPNELFKRGEVNAVLEFLNDCRSTWNGAPYWVEMWTSQIEAGEYPRFKQHLDHLP